VRAPRQRDGEGKRRGSGRRSRGRADVGKDGRGEEYEGTKRAKVRGMGGEGGGYALTKMLII